MPSPVTTPSPRAGGIGLARRRRSRPRRSARPRDLPGPRSRQHAGRRSRPRRIAQRRRCRSPRQRAPAIGSIVGDELLAENYPTIHAVGRASSRPPRLVDIVWGDAVSAEGDLGRQGRVLRHRRSRPQNRLGHAADEKGHGRCRDRARPRPGDHGREAAGAAARAAALRREFGLRQRHAAARHRPHAQGADRRDRQHRCRRPADPVRRAGRSLDRKAGTADRHGDPDRGGAGGARPRTGGAVLQ